MRRARRTRITLTGQIQITLLPATAPAGDEDRPASEPTRVDRERAWSKQRDGERCRQADECRSGVDAYQQGAFRQAEERGGMDKTDRGGEQSRAEADRQAHASSEQRGAYQSRERVDTRRRQRHPCLRSDCRSDSHAQQQEGKPRPVAWIVENVPAP